MKRILFLLLLISPCTHAEFCGYIDHSATSQRLEIPLYRSDTGQSMTGLLSTSTNLAISVKSNASTSATAYTSAGSTIETITTVGTYVAPTATMIRFKETAIAGVYALYGADALWAVAGSAQVVVSIGGVTSLLDKRCVFYQDAITAAALTANTNAALAAYGGGGVAQEDTVLDNTIPEADIATLVNQTTMLANQGDMITTLSEIPNVVWDEPVTEHVVADSTGEALNDAGAAGSPPTVAEIWGGVCEPNGSLTFGQCLRLMLSYAFGETNDNTPSSGQATYFDPTGTDILAIGSYGETGRDNMTLTPDN